MLSLTSWRAAVYWGAGWNISTMLFVLYLLLLLLYLLLLYLLLLLYICKICICTYIYVYVRACIHVCMCVCARASLVIYMLNYHANNTDLFKENAQPALPSDCRAQSFRQQQGFIGF